MTGEKLKFQKITGRKKRKTHKPSILQQQDGTCYLCARLHNDHRIYKYQEEHHIFPGNPGRQISEAQGFKVYLCIDHHRTGPEAVHTNRKVARLLQQDAQRAFEQTGSRARFMELIGRNYLEDEDG